MPGVGQDAPLSFIIIRRMSADISQFFEADLAIDAS